MIPNAPKPAEAPPWTLSWLQAEVTPRAGMRLSQAYLRGYIAAEAAGLELLFADGPVAPSLSATTEQSPF